MSRTYCFTWSVSVSRCQIGAVCFFMLWGLRTKREKTLITRCLCATRPPQFVVKPNNTEISELTRLYIVLYNNLYTPGVSFADAMAFFSLVFSLVCFASFFVSILSLKPRPFVQSSVPIATRLSFFLSFCLFFVYLEKTSLFPSTFFFYHFRFLFVWTIEYCTSYVISFRMMMVFFYLVTTGWIFDVSLLCENSINQSIKYQI